MIRYNIQASSVKFEYNGKVFEIEENYSGWADVSGHPNSFTVYIWKKLDFSHMTYMDLIKESLRGSRFEDNNKIASILYKYGNEIIAALNNNNHRQSSYPQKQEDKDVDEIIFRVKALLSCPYERLYHSYNRMEFINNPFNFHTITWATEEAKKRFG